MFLVKLNFVAFMTALQSLATGSEKTQDTSPYQTLQNNSSGGLCNFIFRHANIVSTSSPGTTMIADIAVNTDRRRASFAAPSFIRNIGDLSNLRGVEEYDVSGFNVVQRFGHARIGELAEFFFYRMDRTVDWKSTDLEKLYPPDAVFSGGKWIKGERNLPRR